MHHLERHLAADERVLGKEDRGERAAPELALDAQVAELLARRDAFGTAHLTILEPQ